MSQKHLILLMVMVLHSSCSTPSNSTTSTIDWQQEASRQLSIARSELGGSPAFSSPAANLAIVARALDASMEAAKRAERPEILAEARFLRACVRVFQGDYLTAYETFKQMSESDSIPLRWAYQATLWMEIAARNRRWIGPRLPPPSWVEMDMLSYNPLQIARGSAERSNRLSTRMVDKGALSEFAAATAHFWTLIGESKFLMATTRGYYASSQKELPEMTRADAGDFLKAPWNQALRADAQRAGIDMTRLSIQRRLWAATLLSRIGDTRGSHRLFAQCITEPDPVYSVIARLDMAETLLAPEHGLHRLELPSMLSAFNGGVGRKPKGELARRALRDADERKAWELLNEARLASKHSGKIRLQGESLLRSAGLRLLRAMEATAHEQRNRQLGLAAAELDAAEPLLQKAGDLLAVRRAHFVRMIISIERADFQKARSLTSSIQGLQLDGMTLGFGDLLRTLGMHALSERGDTVRGFAFLDLAEALFSDAGALMAATRTAIGKGMLQIELGLPARAALTFMSGERQFTLATKQAKYSRQLTSVKKRIYSLEFAIQRAATLIASFTPWSGPARRTTDLAQNELEQEIRTASYALGVPWPDRGVSMKSLKKILRPLIARNEWRFRQIERARKTKESQHALIESYSDSQNLFLRLISGMIHLQLLRYSGAFYRDKNEAVRTGIASFDDAQALGPEFPDIDMSALIFSSKGLCEKIPQSLLKRGGNHTMQTLLGSKFVTPIHRASEYARNIGHLLTCHMAQETVPHVVELKKLIRSPEIWERLTPDAWNHFLSIGEAELYIKNMASGLTWIRRAITAFERQRRIFVDETARKSFSTDAAMMFGAMVEGLVLAGKTENQSTHFEEAFQWVERAKARGFIESMLAHKSLTRLAEENTALGQWYRLSRQYESLAKHALTRTHDATVQARLLSVDRELKKLKESSANTTEQSMIRLLTAARTQDVPSTAEIARKLPADGILVEYFMHRDILFIWTLDSTGRLSVHREQLRPQDLYEQPNAQGPLAAAPLQLFRRVSQYVGRIANGDDMRYLGPDAKLLSHFLIRPIERQLTGKRRVVIIPHSFLHFLPFDLLQQNGQFLYQSHDISYMPSATAVLNMTPIRSGNNARNVPAYFAYKPSAPRWSLGLKALSSVYSNPQVHQLVGDTGDSFTQELQNMVSGRAGGIIHLAVHGEITNPDPERVGLVVRDDTPKRYATDFNVMGLDLNKVELVVLASCKSYEAGLASGDELSSLVRAFHIAGANSVVASLWQLTSPRSAELFKLFYQLYAQSGDAVAALAEAKRQFASRAGRYYGHPKHWAALVASGI